jgi:hypothetical protein
MLLIADKTALESLLSSGANIPTLAEGSTESFALPNRVRKFFKFNVSNSNTLDFSSTLNFAGIATGNHNATITLLKVVNDIVVDLGTIRITTNFVRFSKELFAGIHYIAIASISGNYTGSIKYVSTDFVQDVNLSTSCYSGQTQTADLTVKKASKGCGDDLIYKLVEGELPPGLRMALSGRIFGKVHAIDTMMAAKTFPPSVNMFYSDPYNETTAIGLSFRFKAIVIAGVGETASSDMKWFEILVLNNWSKDTEKFIGMPLTEFVKTRIVTFTSKMVEIAKTLCPDEKLDTQEFIPVQIQRLDERVLVDDVWQPTTIPAMVVKADTPEFKSWKDRYDQIDKNSMTLDDVAFISDYEKTSAFLENQGTAIKAPEIEIEIELANGRNESDVDSKLFKLRNENNVSLPMQANFRAGVKLYLELTNA